MMFRPQSPVLLLLAALALLLASVLGSAGALLWAQQPEDAGVESGPAQGDSSGSYEVGGIEVDVTAKSAEAARLAGWRIAQRKGWALLSRRLGAGGRTLSDGALDSMVTGIVIESEQIGPTRYVARLGLLFSRAKSGAALGVGGRSERSAPMLLMPLVWSGGAGIVFEQATVWDEAWTRFRSGNSTVDYVRPTGTGTDGMLLNAGQVGRPARGWWRAILDQYGASDVLMPVVRLQRGWPGGPVTGTFEARFGPDNRLLARFALRAPNAQSLPAMLDEGVKRIDAVYQAALKADLLSPDPTLAPRPVALAPLELDLSAEEAAAEADVSGQVTTISVQYETPGSGAVSATEAAMRTIPGVRSAVTDSLAIGGISVMRVSYAGDAAAFQAALESRGWQVQGSGSTIRIRRPSGSSGGGGGSATDG